MEPPPTPYALDEPPTSPGRVFLASALSHWAALHHGLAPEEIASALAGGFVDDAAARQAKRSARVLGELAAIGALRTWARPMGGGVPVPLPAGVWELDDYSKRFATCAIKLDQPYGADGGEDHWILLDLDDFNRLTTESLGEVEQANGHCANDEAHSNLSEAGGIRVTSRSPMEFHLRLADVTARTRLSRSTIYRRIAEGTFPATVQGNGGVAAWRESEISDWLSGTWLTRA